VNVDMTSTLPVYIVHHVRALPQGAEEVKLIGVSSTVERLKSAKGFKTYPEGLSVRPYVLDQNHWTERFITV
jgi:hypothetical protein